ncbi:nwd2 [Moniliophthora roreri MCA 2997]|uniref:Nwd2 n=1 Tax=Moniliophthora roreri (strain MCA 2997) TaxID=1381753 RepID=V2WPE6_MONRO|nr:nwd2 [Moniliophthora roreri MCA 2997]
MSFSGSSNFIVLGGAYNVVHGDQINDSRIITNYTGRTDESFHKLAEQVAVNALHSSEQRSPPPNCHPGTRARILDELSRWIEHGPKSTRVYWLHGPAGVGKSAIAQHLSEKYASTRLAGSFFFSRNDPTRDKIGAFVATIAYQLSTSEPLKDLLGPHIIEAIQSDPHIFHSSQENQFRKLILVPSTKIDSAKWRNLPRLIVIDGLDECVDLPSQERLLVIIREAIALATPMPFVFLVCSRPEPRIRYGFDHGTFKPVLGRSTVASSPESNRDVELFLRDMFAALRVKHAQFLRYEDPSWPGDDVIHQLVKRASGQFIFATTIIKYLDCDDDLPSERLDVILAVSNGLPSSPYPELDHLYHQILSSCSNWQGTCQILSLLVTPHENRPGTAKAQFVWRSCRIIEGLLKLRPGQLSMRLIKLHSVIHIPDDEDSEIYVLHASFTEFLLDRGRSGKYHVERLTPEHYWDLVAQLLLRMHSVLSFPPYSTWQTLSERLLSWEALLQNEESSFSQLVFYSCAFWSDFCCRKENPSRELLEALDKFDPYPVLTMDLHYRARYLKEARRSFVNWEHKLGWEQCLTWAKTLGERTPRKFVDTLETFYLGYSISFHPKTSQYWAYVSSVLETYLYFKSSRTQEFYRELYLGDRMPLIPPSHTVDPSPSPFPFMHPASRQPVLPADWITVHITRTEAEAFHNLLLTLVPGDDLESIQRLIEDVLNDTHKSVDTDLDKQQDFVRFKDIVLKHRRTFGLQT